MVKKDSAPATNGNGAAAAEPSADLAAARSFLSEFPEILAKLKERVDPGMIRTREGWTDRQGNKHMVEYVEWHYVADQLDLICPDWSHSVRDLQIIGDQVACTVALTIKGVTREGVGCGTAESEMGIKKAEHDALKRAAVKFGVARELYQKESDIIERAGSSNGQPAGPPRDPLAKSMADLVTNKQLGMIRALCREAGVDADEEASQILGCKSEELSKKAASWFISYLKGENEGPSGNFQPQPAASGSNGNGNGQGRSGSRQGSHLSAVDNGEKVTAGQATAIDKLIQQLRDLGAGDAAELSALVVGVGCEDLERITFTQAGILITRLQEKIAEVKQAARAGSGRG